MGAGGTMITIFSDEDARQEFWNSTMKKYIKYRKSIPQTKMAAQFRLSETRQVSHSIGNAKLV